MDNCTQKVAFMVAFFQIISELFIATLIYGVTLQNGNQMNEIVGDCGKNTIPIL
jgi:hypothetical protein